MKTTIRVNKEFLDTKLFKNEVIKRVFAAELGRQYDDLVVDADYYIPKENLRNCGVLVANSLRDTRLLVDKFMFNQLAANIIGMPMLTKLCNTFSGPSVVEMLSPHESDVDTEIKRLSVHPTSAIVGMYIVALYIEYIYELQGLKPHRNIVLNSKFVGFEGIDFDYDFEDYLVKLMSDTIFAMILEYGPNEYYESYRYPDGLKSRRSWSETSPAITKLYMSLWNTVLELYNHATIVYKNLPSVDELVVFVMSKYVILLDYVPDAYNELFVNKATLQDDATVIRVANLLTDKIQKGERRFVDKYHTYRTGEITRDIMTSSATSSNIAFPGPNKMCVEMYRACINSKDHSVRQSPQTSPIYYILIPYPPCTSGQLDSPAYMTKIYSSIPTINDLIWCRLQRINLAYKVLQVKLHTVGILLHEPILNMLAIGVTPILACFKYANYVNIYLMMHDLVLNSNLEHSWFTSFIKGVEIFTPVKD